MASRTEHMDGKTLFVLWNHYVLVDKHFYVVGILVLFAKSVDPYVEAG